VLGFDALKAPLQLLARVEADDNHTDFALQHLSIETGIWLKKSPSRSGSAIQ
jgi:hypothetical protein